MSQADTFICPHCDRQYRFKPELEGKRIRCKCGEKFTVEAPILEEPDDEIDGYDLHDEPAEHEGEGPDWSALLGPEGGAAAAAPVELSANVCPNCRAAIKPGAALCIQCGTDLRSGKKRGKTKITQAKDTAHDSTASAVRTKIAGVGLLIHGIGYLGMMLAVILFFIAGWQAAKQNPIADSLMAGAGISFIIGIPMLLLGPFLCLTTPKDAGLLFLIGSIGLYFVGMASFVVVGIYQDQLPDIVVFAAVLPQTFAAGCFVAFMRQMAEYIGAGSVYENTDFLLKTWKYIAITSVLLLLPFIGCLVLVVWIIAQTIFALSYGWIVCQAGLAAVRS